MVFHLPAKSVKGVKVVEQTSAGFSEKKKNRKQKHREPLTLNIRISKKLRKKKLEGMKS